MSSPTERRPCPECGRTVRLGTASGAFYSHNRPQSTSVCSGSGRVASGGDGGRRETHQPVISIERQPSIEVSHRQRVKAEASIEHRRRELTALATSSLTELPEPFDQALYLMAMRTEINRRLLLLTSTSTTEQALSRVRDWTQEQVQETATNAMTRIEAGRTKVKESSIDNESGSSIRAIPSGLPSHGKRY